MDELMKRKIFLFTASICIIGTFQSCGYNSNQQKGFSLFEKEVSSEVSHSPIVGLALGGGGAKASAEIGVLKFLEKENIRVNCIAGSSMGAVIGGLYAAGYSAQEIEEMWLTEDWLALFEETAVFVGGDRTIFGLIRGDDFEENLRRALLRKSCVRIEDTERNKKIKFCCTATRIVNKASLSEVDLDTGDMAKAIRASMTYPAPVVGYKPFHYYGMRLADGGLLNNLPVDVVRKMGAEIVIAVDLETMQKNNKKHSGLKTGIGWLVDWLIAHPDVNKHNQNREDADVYIHPDLSDYNILDFGEMDARDMMLYGEDEAKKHKREIKKLSKRLDI